MKHSTKHNPTKRTAALLCAAMLGLSLAAARTSAQVTGPLAAPNASPPTPTPFQSPVFHSGGGPGATYPVDPASAPFLDPLLNPLQGQLQGTPTELYSPTGAAPYSFTQIPSFLLGNYNPALPPAGLQGNVAGGVNTYFANHFADGGFFTWAAPFAYTLASASAVTVDDNAPAPVAGVSGFSATNTFAPVIDPVNFPSAGTATNGEYLRLPPGTDGSAVWTLYQPAAGNYSLYFHIPNDLPDASGAAEPRSTTVQYSISVRDTAGNVTSTTTATASQTEANDSQFLAGPFELAAGGTVTVTLLRSTALKVNVSTVDYLVADSVTLQPTTGDVQSTPAVITRNRFLPEFTSTIHPLQYWGTFIPPGTPVQYTASQAAGVQATANAIPDTTTATVDPTQIATTNNGNIILRTGGLTDPLRAIRQLVYFGRADPAASVSNSVDDSAPAPGGTTLSGFTSNGAATPVSNTTASTGEYKAYGAATGSAPTLAAPAFAAATWAVTVPSSASSTNYFVYAHIPANQNNEKRLARAFYRVLVNGVPFAVVSISQVSQGADASVVLPTGPIPAAAGAVITVELNSVNAEGATGSPVVVADSVTVSTGTGQGAIYCVDGFNGGVVWRYETPGSANGSSSPVFSSPAITRINVMVAPPVFGTTTPAVYANRLVLIIGDNNGLVYCLDAIGNGDGTSNVDVLAKDANGQPIPNQPVTLPQPAYGGLYGAVATAPYTPLVAGTPATANAANAHVGTTGTYWIYRPDPNRPKYVVGANVGRVKIPDPTTDLPVPASFNTASPNVFVDPTVSTTPIVAAGPLTSNAIVYMGNSNGVLYALDALGVAIDGITPDSVIAPGNATSAAAFAATGDKFNVSQDLQTGLVTRVPTPQPLWWFSVRGVDPNGPNNTSSADIESAPALYVKHIATAPNGIIGTAYQPTVYIGSAHEQEVTSNVGRLYALNGLYGPSFNNGRFSPIPLATNYAPPGSFNYNVGQVPQTDANDTLDWSFPDGNNTTASANNPLAAFKHQSSTGLPRPALGNMTGSPVVFTNLNETVNNPTRVYVAANSGLEYPATARPDANQTGRIWAVNLDGSVGSTTRGAIGTGTTSLTNGVWAYPLANDPNNAASDKTAEPYAPIGAFVRGTPAIGFVQFPANITLGDAGATQYVHPDAVNTTLQSKSVPMLYIGTAGVNDTALYGVDIDGGMAAPQSLTNDQRTIFRLITPDGSIYQSSPALIANATSAGGNGGSVYAVAGNTLYDYGATPISNPFYTSANPQPYPLFRLNSKFPATIGPVSSPAVAGADITDNSQPNFILSATNPTGTYPTNTADWVYVGDSSGGFCRGFTPFDNTYGGIEFGLNRIVPYDVTTTGGQVLTASIQTFLVGDKTSASSADALTFGPNSALQVYEWGESAAIRFTNVAPKNPIDIKTGKDDPNLYVHDTRLYPDLTAATTTDPIPFYSSDGTPAQTVTFNLSDFDATTNSILQQDNGSVQQNLIIAPQTPPDGFTADLAANPNPAFPDVTTNLVANNGKRYLGTYTYTIGDGSGRNNTPGARRRLLNVRQVVTQYLYDGTNYTKMGTAIIGGDATGENLVTVKDASGKFTFTNASKVAAVDQPTFGILNPLGVRGGGVPLLPLGSTVAVAIGDETGPFRSVKGTNPLPVFGSPTTGDVLGLQALSNGNDILTYAPPSSSGVAGSAGPSGNPTALPNAATDPLAPAPTVTKVVVTATGLIPDNSVGDNSEQTPTNAPTGTYSGVGTDGLRVTTFGGYSLNAFDRSALFNLAQTLRLKATVPATALNAPASGRDGLYWNSNVVNPATDHDSTVNFLPWETAPIPYSVGINTSLDYPDLAPGNIAQNALSTSTSSGGDLTSNSVTLPPGSVPQGAGGTLDDKIKNRIVSGDPVQIKITVPHHQSANQQLYQEDGNNQAYTSTGGHMYVPTGQTPPVNSNGGNQINGRDNVFPMGYITTKRLFVPSAGGNYNAQRPYRDVRVYTGVPINMRTSIATTTTDIGRVPAAFGVQTEQYQPAVNPLGYFTPYNPAYASANIIQSYFKPLEVHNDGNVNLLNVHFDQKAHPAPNNGTITVPITQTVHLYSDTDSLLSVLDGYDIYTTTGPRVGALNNVPEQPYLIRTSLDSDIFRAYGQNPYFNGNAAYPGATFHKPAVGSDQPSILTVPDAPNSYVFGASLETSPAPVMPVTGSLVTKSAPFVSIAFPFGTPAGTYTMTPAGALRLFEGLDTAAPNAYSTNPTAPGSGIPSILYPPKYGGAVGGIGGYNPSSPPVPNVDTAEAGQPKDANNIDEDIYNGLQPLSTTGTQLSGTVIEQRLTDGFTYGAVPMIDAGLAGAAVGNNPAATPDFAPAAFRDPASGNLSAYWTSGRSTNGYSIYGANLGFTQYPAANTNGLGYFAPFDATTRWWKPFIPSLATTGTNSGLSVTTTPNGTDYAFAVNVAVGTPYNNTLYAYPVLPKFGTISAGTGVPVTPPTDGSQVKYGVKGLYAPNFANNLWAFWTASTRGRTALYYSPQSAWGTANTPALSPTLLPVPAGLTAVSDASPLIITAPVPSASGAATYQDVAEVTYSGIGPDGNADLYVSRYLPHGTTAATGAAQLDQVPYPAVTENLTATTTGSVKTGWFQARDVAWSRTGALNITVPVISSTGVTQKPLLYDTTAPFAPKFTKAIYDKASGYLVLTGVQVPYATQPASGPLGTTNTVYVDAATGRIRFSPALLPTQTFPTIRATFSPLARRLTTDTRADVAPVTFLDDTPKPNDAASVPNSLYAPGTASAVVNAGRRWTIWRKAGVPGLPATATLYYKTQRLTLFLPTSVTAAHPTPSAIDVTQPITITLTGSGTAYTGPVDVDYLRGRLYFPVNVNQTAPLVSSQIEGQQVRVTYTDTNGQVHNGTTNGTTPPAVIDTVQWQDEQPANGQTQSNDILPTDSVSGLDTVVDTLVPLQTATNENNVTAFLDPFAGTTAANGVSLNPHKVWLFWNSTRNGTADIYSETIDPRFAPAPTIP